MKKGEYNGKMRKLTSRYIILISISLLFILSINIIFFSYQKQSDTENNLIIMVRNIIRVADKSRTELDKIWNLNYIGKSKEYKEEFKTNSMELIPILISIRDIKESINELNFNINNKTDKQHKITFKALMVDPINDIFNEPTPNEQKIINHIMEYGFGDYRIERNRILEFYRPIIIKHNRLENVFGTTFDTVKGSVIGFYKIEIPKDITYSEYSIFEYLLIIGLNLIIIAIILFLFFFSIRNRTKRLYQVIDVLDNMSKGNFIQNINSNSSDDEIGRIFDYLSKICVHIREMGKELNSTVEYTQNSSETFHQFSTELSTFSKKQFIQIQEINDAITNLTNEISHSTNIAGEVNTKSQNSFSTAESSTKFVNDVVSDMVELSKSTKKIEDILKIIKEIAFQTNLLAHNASIEAARAGEQGKGFSVVAQSVSELAKKSADSTKEIEELIKNSINGLERGTQKVTTVGENFKTIKNQLEEMANMVNEINGILKKQSEESYHVRDSINRINKISQETSNKATIMEENIEELKTKTQSLKTILEKNKFYDYSKSDDKLTIKK